MGHSDKPVLARIPDELVGNVVIDLTGHTWILEEPELESGFFKNHEVINVRPREFSIATSVGNAITAAAENHFKQWLEDDVPTALGSFNRSKAASIERLLNGGQREFRRKFVESIATVGVKTFRDMLEQSFDEIGKRWSNNNRNNIASTGLVPRGCRFVWHHNTENGKLAAYVIELEPHVRSIMFWNSRRRFAFPWMYFIVYFRNGSLVTLDSLNGLSVFYRPDELSGASDSLNLTNLSHTWTNLPRFTCLSGKQPPIVLSDQQWNNKLLDAYWGSNFSHYDDDRVLMYANHKQKGIDWNRDFYRIPEVSSPERWEALSRQDPSAVLKLPWRKAPLTLEDEVEQTFVCLERVFAGNKHADGQSEKQTKFKKQLVTNFNERLQEALIFLAGHLVIPADLKQTVVEQTSKEMLPAIEQLHASLEKRVASTVKDATRKFYADNALPERSVQ